MVGVVENLLSHIEVTEEADALLHIRWVLEVLWGQVGVEGNCGWGQNCWRRSCGNLSSRLLVAGLRGSLTRRNLRSLNLI